MAAHVLGTSEVMGSNPGKPEDIPFKNLNLNADSKVAHSDTCCGGYPPLMKV